MKLNFSLFLPSFGSHQTVTVSELYNFCFQALSILSLLSKMPSPVLLPSPQHIFVLLENSCLSFKTNHLIFEV